ncbi:hypothetical protein DPMN_164727 [Dreissena polymorpha]|uniref:Defensin n=1 Tax=Dreissena polymorpha TaxID=45954 RepID=A0A9D4ITZ0_DREPO|nr:hypothetical protein DPMN_164727 [Dreissena polymorpha]
MTSKLIVCLLLLTALATISAAPARRDCGTTGCNALCGLLNHPGGHCTNGVCYCNDGSLFG